MPTPQTKNWNLGFKTASATYSKLQSGIGNVLTNRRIAHYCRTGYYGDHAQQQQLELDQSKKPGYASKQRKVAAAAMVDDLA